MELLQKEEVAKNIAARIKDVVRKRKDFKRYIFLCGASPQKKDSLRNSFLTKFEKNYTSFFYEILYPEDIFNTLLSGTKNFDLLSLENELAKSVDVILILLESESTYAELGAFTNHNELKNKVICIQNLKYKRSKSFITRGPIRQLVKQNKSNVVYLDFAKILIKGFTDGENELIFSSIRKLIRNSSKAKTDFSLIMSQYYILVCVYLLEPISKESLMKLLMYAFEIDLQLAKIVTTSASSLLIRNKLIESTTLGYKLSIIGLNKFYKKKNQRKSEYSYLIPDLDALRIDILNWNESKGLPIRCKLR